MEDYFRYFPANPNLRCWGAVLTASGIARVSAGSSYPPPNHPEDHQLDWAHGRVLESLQIVLITEGSGHLETRTTGLRQVKTGVAFMLLPDMWHRYAPDPVTGWAESWIELEGSVIDSLLGNQTFSRETVLRSGAIEVGLEETLNRIHRRVLSGVSTNTPELCALALQALTQFAAIEALPKQRSKADVAVEQAQNYFHQSFRDPMTIEALAEQLGIAYSHFRRVFRTRTGLTPWQYVIRLRLRQARRIMAASDSTLEEIAGQVGFSSGFHLSSSFKQVYEVSPDAWRKSLQG